MALLHMIEPLRNHPFCAISGFILLLTFIYVLYQQFIHSLSKYPGPFMASLTDIWQVSQFLSLRQPYRLTELHQRYGPIVRYGPNKISITHEEAISAIYQKSSRSMPKTEFYDAFGGFHPNVFGTRDEAHHAVRRRHMSHSFSMTSIKEMEYLLDANINILRAKIRRRALAGETFDLKKALHYYVVDVLFELAFSGSFNVQESEDDSQMPPVKEHTLLGSAIGAWTNMRLVLKKWLPMLPSKRVQALFDGRKACIELASRSVQKRLNDLEMEKDNEVAGKGQQRDLLTRLILAKDPETGQRLTQQDLETEAFGFIIAGTHTTTATTALLFWNLLHNPKYMNECVKEIDARFHTLEDSQSAYSIAQVEGSLSFLRKCVKENFRITPVFTMPLERRVTAAEGVSISGHHFPQGTSLAVCNHAFHHNPAVWGEDHNIFDPYRHQNIEHGSSLFHFGLGGRQCIGKSMALANIYKISSTLLKEFDFQLADEEERLAVERGHFHGVLPQLISVGVSDLEGPLMVKAKLRDMRLKV
ncbi:putative benzoate 4-monooxygenase cytochrome P450 [Aaosphaeria arxii CBS 175.79]|uniref:Putative benzoate 4-monooxygenase cytochrome P450 n=1 Tax=Aaosphaeria arxii CBS 175.79 TaxID=1450172 RepID=A0A6A5Y3V6_9PLEO|nr:putative benzoate 4-monooxygenase cytochrome P450 [Aaosphaeria arxii CBS 175.79]KAF2020168.1 putative benzoate 4-monooxygenase cytochrome P450 [Aaosphaeria arxii CBS 175.79]